jgi:hypothetical protein
MEGQVQIVTTKYLMDLKEKPFHYCGEEQKSYCSGLRMKLV